ncbi:MAG: hypothetical protein QOF84_2251 [Streptomyces sp.]|nr:hypothetical protein [Streptomyces sp.]
MSGQYAPHPHIGGRTAALRALAAWRMEWPGTPRCVVLTGSSGSGVSRLLTGFLMLCDPEFRKQLPLAELDPTIVPPELPAPAVPGPDGLTAAQLLWVLADHLGLKASRVEDVYAELAALDAPVTVVVPDVDLAGAIRGLDEPARLVREVLRPLATTETVRLLADVPRPLAAELAAGLPPGTVQVIDLDEPEWDDPEGLLLQADALLSPQFGAPELPFTADSEARERLAGAIAGRAAANGPGGSRLTVQLAVNGVLMAPEGFDPADERWLPRGIGEALDLHARRLGAEPGLLRQMLLPLALAEGQGLPLQLWAPLASAVAGRDMGEAIAGAMTLAGPFVTPGESAGDGRTLLRLLHPGLAEELRSGLPDGGRAAQTQIAVALLEQVPAQNWAEADPYVRDYIAGHALAAGLLPQLLTDPGLFTYADPVTLRAAVDAVPLEALGAPARTYRRVAPLLTRTEAPEVLRAALLETAFVEDGLRDYADAVHALGLALPWRTLWSVPVPGVSAVTAAALPAPSPEAEPSRVAVLVVPEGTPGALPLGGAAVLVHGLTEPTPAPQDSLDPAAILRPDEDERAAAPLALSRGADYVRVWNRASEEVVAAVISDVPFTGADLSPDGVLLLATERGAKALRITTPA